MALRPDAPRTATPAPTRQRSLAKTMAAVFGAAFLLVGVAGFIPGLTQHLDDIEFAGHESGAELLGVFQVSVLHNIVHLLFGIVGLAASRHWRAARTYLLAGGAVYLVLWIYGLAIERDSDANVVPLNEADDWLHLGLGVAMVLFGIASMAPDRRTEYDTQTTGDLRR